MPVGNRKNLLYGMALPVFGKRCHWKTATGHGVAGVNLTRPITRALRKHHVVGGCVQLIRNGTLAECYSAGYATLEPDRPARPDTVFRTASVAKMACALLVFRLQTLGRLDVNIDISDLWGDRIRNPLYPDTPIPLSALLSHTSGIVDSALYYSSFQKTVPVRELLADPATYANRPPFARFQYSNFAAGLVGCLLEKRFGESFETLAQRELFLPLGADATFDISALCGRSMADSYRVLPPQKSASFNAQARFQAASPLDTPDPQTHYLLASGSLFITAEGLARLTLPLIQRAAPDCAPFLNPEACRAMLTPTAAWPEPAVRMRHGMGLLEMDDPRIHPHCLHGHQGFAYGAVNGVFFDEHGNGFASLNSGASERRLGHLSCLNRDLIALCIPGVSE